MTTVQYRQSISDSLAQLIEDLIPSQIEERPTKRRKVAQNATEDQILREDISASEGNVVLCRIIIDLDGPDVPVKETLSPAKAVPIFLKYRNEQPVLSSPDLSFSGSPADSADQRCQHWLDILTTNRKLKLAISLSGKSDVDNVVSHLSMGTCAPSIDTPAGERSYFSYKARLSTSTKPQSYRICIDYLWKNTLYIPTGSKVKGLTEAAFNKYTPPGEGIYLEISPQINNAKSTHPGWTPRDFYDNVYIPSDTPEASKEITCPLVKCKLYPFQNRAVRWLLEREGMELDAYGNISPHKIVTQGLPESFREFVDADGRRCFSSQLYRVVATDMSPWEDSNITLRGGILAEEMGLGKTVEMISLISLHRRDMAINDNIHDSLINSQATLIITPPAILEQWKQELQNHAPSLTVFEYKGYQANSELSQEQLLQTFKDSDVVLTTYNILAREVHYAVEPPQRNMRNAKRFAVPKSPLVLMSWWRVCLDEAQMIESGVSNAAQVARLVPRVNAWAVTGTPIRKDMRDFFGLLQFLRYEPFCGSMDLWGRLYNVCYPAFRSIVNRLALRHSKEFIRNDLKLPPQKRVVITIPFTAVEEQHYSQLFEQMCEDCGVDSSGAPLEQNWNPESQASIEKMRSWLTRLRQTCLHPEVARRNRKALGITNGPLRSVDEVLGIMIDQNETAIRAEERSLILSQVRRGQIYENALCRREALQLWQDGLERATQIVKDCREQLQIELDKFQTNGQGVSMKFDSDDAESDNDEEQSGKTTRIGTCRSRLRSALEVQHVCKFFTANAFYQIKTDEKLTAPDSEEYKALENTERDAYDEAKLIRQEMLKDIARKVNRFIKILNDKARNDAFVKIPVVKVHPPTLGVEARRIFERLEDLRDALNENRNQFMKLRDSMLKLLCQSLVDEEQANELEGNEYETSTKHQDKMYVYMEGLRVMFADRHDALTGQSNYLIKNEVRFAVAEARAGNGPSPELYLEIMGIRDKIKPKDDLGSLRGIVSDMRSLVTSLDWQATEGSTRAKAEYVIVNDALDRVSKVSAEQAKAVANLDKEVDLFRDTMNNRLEYYRQLQQISDTVAPYDEESVGKPMDLVAYNQKLEAEKKIQHRLDGLQSKRRYLIHLRDESGPNKSTRLCIICQSTFEIGVLTVCGHEYCKDCLRVWWHQHRSCPTCKRTLKANDFHQITYKPKELLAQEEKTPTTKQENERPSQNGIYSDISTGILQEIKDIDLPTSFGTKIDTLSRHLMWLREHDPGAKSIVFSQYRDFLGVLGTAFARFKIGYSSVEAKDGIRKFKEDPATECFLLHARAHSSGLNLVNATHVFLCEPLINTAIELQAIARVHRIGQHRPTTVWMYLVSDTVEQSIYQISVARRMNHIVQKRNQKHGSKKHPSPTPNLLRNGTTAQDLTENAIESANSLEMQDATLGRLLASGAAGGELVSKDDLWQCLFGGDGQKRTSSFNQNEDAVREVDRYLRAEAAEKRRLD